MKLTVQEIQEWLTQFAEAINQNKQYLSDLDTPIGDGDHGNNMGRGVSAYEEAFQADHPETISDTFKVFSMAMISKVGGGFWSVIRICIHEHDESDKRGRFY